MFSQYTHVRTYTHQLLVLRSNRSPNQHQPHTVPPIHEAPSSPLILYRHKPRCTTTPLRRALHAVLHGTTTTTASTSRGCCMLAQRSRAEQDASLPMHSSTPPQPAAAKETTPAHLPQCSYSQTRKTTHKHHSSFVPRPACPPCGSGYRTEIHS